MKFLFYFAVLIILLYLPDKGVLYEMSQKRLKFYVTLIKM